MTDIDFKLKADMKEEYTLEDIDLNFRKELSDQIGAKSLLQCIQCGVCSSGCTVSEYIDLQPHRMVASCLLGLKDLVLNSNAIWICSLCHRCTERCPKFVDYSFLLALLRNLAVKNGKVPPDFVAVLDTIAENGIVVPVSDGLNQRREKMGIPKVPPPNVEQTKKLIQLCGMDGLLKKDKKEAGK